jgi:hypothetical protein
MISDISKKTKATITYDGLLRGENYTDFLQKCDIGLSTQIPDQIYNESSFPSKVLSYMANGLMVVSVRIKVIEISAINSEVYYYEGRDPRSISDAIQKITSVNLHDCTTILRKLDYQFKCNLLSMLENE